MRWQICAVLLLSAAPVYAQSQQEWAAKFQAMEARLESLESEVKTLKAALAVAATPEAPPAAEPAPLPQAAPAIVSQSGSPDPTASARLMNPAVAVIGNFLGAAGRNPIDPRPSLEMTESEVSMSAAVDPYARADFFFSFGEAGVEVEEGYLTLPRLPAGFLVKAGRMRSQFGKVNTLHRHVVPWVDRPLVTANLVGGEDGIRDSGFSVNHLLPAPGGIFLEATGEIYRGDAEGVFESRRRNDLATVGHLRGYRDLSDSTNLDMGFSFARGHNGLPSAAPDESLTTSIYGMDGTLRWKPLRTGLYHSFVGRSELVWSRRREELGTQKAFGYYVSGDYQLARRWFAGVRLDQSDRATAAAMRDSGVSAVLTYWPSEFSQIRGQYRHTRYAEEVTANELLFQFQYSIGAHGAHPF